MLICMLIMDMLIVIVRYKGPAFSTKLLLPIYMLSPRYSAIPLETSSANPVYVSHTVANFLESHTHKMSSSNVLVLSQMKVKVSMSLRIVADTHIVANMYLTTQRR